MTVPVLSNDQLIQHIKENGWHLASNDFWEEEDRLVFRQADADATYIFQLSKSNKHFYDAVVRICSIMKIPPPLDHIRQHFLHHGKFEEECFCNSGKKFKECCS